MGCSKSSSKREVYNDTSLPQETRKISNKQHNFTPKITGGEKNEQNPKLVEGNKGRKGGRKEGGREGREEGGR